MNFIKNKKCAVFRAGESHYAVFRIPAIVKARNGDILAFCEGRLNSGADTGRIDIVMKRSIDNGGTWGALTVIATDGENTCGNPCPLVDRDSGRITMLFCANPCDAIEEEIMQGKGTRSVFKIASDDHGYTWSRPVQITKEVKREHWTWYATGPCHAIQLSTGRYIFPCNHGVAGVIGFGMTRSHLVFSDDGGESFHIGGTAAFDTNECTAAELDGVLYLNMRSRLFGMRRAGAKSYDGGLTLSKTERTDLPDPYCQGAVAAFPEGLLFTNNASESARSNLTLHYSPDMGRTWEKGVQIDHCPTSYSDILMLTDSAVLVLYECGSNFCCEEIDIVQVDIRK